MTALDYAVHYPHLTQANYKKSVSKGLVLVFFYLPWHGPSTRLRGILDNVHDCYEDRVKIFGVEIDREEELFESINSTTTPTFLVYSEGQEILRTPRGGSAIKAALGECVELEDEKRNGR